MISLISLFTISVSGKVVLTLMGLIIFLIFLTVYLRADEIEYEEGFSVEYVPLNLLICIKNTTNEKRIVKLFENGSYLPNDEWVEKKIFHNYLSQEEKILDMKEKPLVFTEMVFQTEKENFISKIIINSYSFFLKDLLKSCKLSYRTQKTYIHNLTIEIQANSEILIIFK
jgi:hypothetical protein